MLSMDTTTILLAIGGTAALLLSGKKKPAAPQKQGRWWRDEPAGQEGTGGTQEGDSSPPGTPATRGTVKGHALAALCSKPNRLTAYQQRVLIDQVFDPLWDEFASGLPQHPGPDQVDSVLHTIALNALKSCNGATSADSLSTAKNLARAVWWKRSGQSGQ